MNYIPSPLATGCYFHLIALFMGAPIWVCVVMGVGAYALAPRVKQNS